MLSELSVYDPRYKLELESMSREERDDWLEDERLLKRGFNTIITLSMLDDGKTPQLCFLQDAIVTYKELEKFSSELCSAKQISIEEAKQIYEKQEKDTVDYWNSYGRLYYLIRNTDSVDKDSIKDYGRIMLDVQTISKSIPKIESFNDAKYPESYAVLYKLSGQSKLTGWINKVFDAKSVNKSTEIYTYDCFAKCSSESSLQDCFEHWIVDNEIVHYVGNQYKSIVSELMRIFSVFADDKLFLLFMDAASIVLFNKMLAGADVAVLLSDVRDVLNGTQYATDFEYIYFEISRRCRSIVSC